MIAEAARPLARREEGTYRQYVTDEQPVAVEVQPAGLLQPGRRTGQQARSSQRCLRRRGPARAFKTFRVEH
jgi:hypothetical protein